MTVYVAYCHVRNACMALMLAWPMRICNNCLLLQSIGMAHACAMFRVALCNMLLSRFARLPVLPRSPVRAEMKRRSACVRRRWRLSCESWFACHQIPGRGSSRGRAAAVLEEVFVAFDGAIVSHMRKLHNTFLVMANGEAITQDYSIA